MNAIDKKELKSKILQKRIISFDIFDTLLKRNVKKPTDVFGLIEKVYSIKKFQTERVQAEKRARKEADSEEINIDDIYKYINYINKEYLKELEFQTEEDILFANPELKEIYDFCCDNEKIIYIISDMYLPKEEIEKILLKCGINRFRKVFVSCEYGKTKKNGTLFKQFLKEEHIKAEDVLHIGDSRISDYRNPRKYGMDSFLIPNKKNSVNTPKLEVRYLNSFKNNHLKEDNNKYYNFGYSKFGPFLWGYVRWLHKEFKNNKIKKAFFLARDGLIMQKAYRISFGKSCIENHYLEVSRRSLRVPILWMNYQLDTLIEMISPSKLIPIKAIFDGVGLDIKNYDFLLKKYGFTEKSTLERKTILENQNLQAIYKDIIGDIISVSKKEYKLLIEYLTQNHVNGKFAVVDIGWSGGMQRYLNQTLSRLEIPHEIIGFYTGIAEYYTYNKAADPSLNLNGYLFDFSHDKHAHDLRSGFVGLFESFFLERDGSVKNYQVIGNNIKAVRYPYEYIINDKVTPEFEKIMMIQEAALKFVEDASTDKFLKLFDFSPEELFMEIYNCGAKPTKDDLNLFANFDFYDEGLTLKLANPQPLFRYLFSPNTLRKDFMQCRWKIGFLKSVMKIPLPYDQIYYALKKIK